MNVQQKELITLEFGPAMDGLCVQETFYPWDITVRRFMNEGLKVNPYGEDPDQKKGLRETFLGNSWAEGVMRYEKELGFDPVLRLGIYLPFLWGIRETLCRNHIENENDFNKLINYSRTVEAKYFTDSDFREVYSPYREGHEKGDYSVRVNIMGFFFASRELFGVENHLYAFYDKPELLHRMNEYLLEFYAAYLTKLLAILPADVLYLSEDLSGKNGPMISPAFCEEFLCRYYKRFFPLLRNMGVKYVFVDTDGDFTDLIPLFISAGVDGFLPMDVQAGMDIVQVRRDFPKLRFIGGYNKLALVKGKCAIDEEFARILPVAKQGGYIIGCDHQPPPETPFENYRYYIKKLTDLSKSARRIQQI